MFRRVADGLLWRWWFLRRYWYLLRTFRNGPELVRAAHTKGECARAVLRDGTTLRHPPGRLGFANTILEIWYDRSYTPPGFYAPADGDVVIDAGANVGLFSVFVARQNPRCRVVAVEPVAENFTALQENVQASRLANVAAHQVALGATCGEGSMVAVGARSLDHRLAVGAEGAGPAVRVVSLAGLLDLAGAPRVALLKVDIEGAEYDAFAHAQPGHLARGDRGRVASDEPLRPGTLALLQERLAPTHTYTIRPEGAGEYGVLLARRR